MAKRSKQKRTMAALVGNLNIHIALSTPTKFRYTPTGGGPRQADPRIEISWNVLIANLETQRTIRIKDQTHLGGAVGLDRAHPNLLNLLSYAIMKNGLTKDAIQHPDSPDVKEVGFTEAEIAQNKKLINKWNRLLAGTGWDLDTLGKLPDALYY